MKVVRNISVIVAVVVASAAIGCSAPNSVDPPKSAAPEDSPEQSNDIGDVRQYITPDDPSVQVLLPQIIEDKAFWRTDFGGIQIWVDNNIDYVPDVDGHWQTPAETLSRRAGDCEDYAILLCSLLRAYGVPAEDIYVAAGFDANDSGHAFVVERWYLRQWRVIEPQDGGLLTTDASAWAIGHTYTIQAVFNDREFQLEPQWLSQMLINGAQPTAASPLSVAFNGWRCGANPVTVARVGDAVAFSVAVSGGSPGPYVLNLVKDAKLGKDTTVRSYTVAHDGASTLETLTWTAVESGSFHLDLSLRDSTVWSQANDSTRLVVR
jgi:hypothetical protein